MPDDFPLAEPKVDTLLARKGITGEETLATRTNRQLAAQDTAAAQKAAQANATGDWTAQQLAAQEEQARLEAEHGRIATIGAQTARGVLDAALAIPALAGAGIESAGELSGIDTLRDFGRAVGQASTGKNALSSFGAAQSAIFGGSKSEGYQSVERDIDAQTQAWPLLSTVSRGAGMVAGAAATGGLSGASELTSTGARAAVAGAEGAGAGAQQQYEQNAPLRDVLTSAVIGGAFAAGTAGALSTGQKWLASRGAREAFGDAAGGRAIKALGARASEVAKLRSGGLTGEEAARAIGNDVLDFKLANGESVFPDTLRKAATMGKEELADRVTQGAAEVGEKLGTLRQAAAAYTESKAPELLPSVDDLSGRIVDDVIKPLEASNLTKGKAGVIYDVIGDLSNTAQDGKVTLSQLLKTREILSEKIWPKNPGGGLTRLAPDALEDLVKTRGIIDETINDTIESASKHMGGETLAGYQALKKTASSLIQARQIVNPSLARDLGNRAFSLSDMLAGSAEFAGEVAGSEGGALLGGVKGLAVAAAHKYIRQQGSTIAAVGLRKLAQGAPELAEAIAPVGISVAAAGGREAQSVINIFSRSRAAVADAVEGAGPNPDMRAVAQRDASEEQARALHEAAGEFHPASIFEQTPTPIQKVVFRGPILDHVSQDIAAGVQSAMQLTPDSDMVLDPARLGRITADANGQAAIGRLQSRVQDILKNAPPTLFGDQIQALAGQSRRELASADVPRSVELAHDLANGLRSFASHAQDDVTRDFAFRQADGLHDDLTSEDMGTFGQLYAKAFPGVQESFSALADQSNVREMLRTAKARGALPGAVKDFADSVGAAQAARSQLTGEKPDANATEQLSALEKRAARAEAAVTLDGGPIGRILDHFEGGPSLPAQGLDTLVTRQVSEHIERLIPHLKSGGDARALAEERKPPPPLLETPEAQQAKYKERIAQLSQSVSDPMAGRLTESLYGHPSIPPDVAMLVGADAQQRAAQLLQDMPKPQQSIRGKAFESLSSDDVRRGNAMWEATMKPMSLFDDFRRGAIDYDKVQYAWKQYPGLQQAAQAGILDALSGHLNDKERERIPDSMLTQCDYLLGFGGKLQGSLDPGFSSRMSAIYQQQQQQAPPQQGAPLNLPGAQPTFTEKMMGNRG